MRPTERGVNNMAERMSSFFQNLKSAFGILYEEVPTESAEQSEENED